MSPQPLSLTEFILGHSGALARFPALMDGIALAARTISIEVNRAGLVGILGLAGRTNVQGEEVQKLDEFAHETVVRCLEETGTISVMGSEEVDSMIPVREPHHCGEYAVLFDPLDGSSNIDVGAPIGTIFSIHRRPAGSGAGGLEDLLRTGREQVAAAYVIYGSSTLLIYSSGQGVHGFTLDPGPGEFLLSHESITIPEKARIYSVNESNTPRWSESMRRWLDDLKSPGPGRAYTARYIGSLVADFHRNLLRGGIFAYPGDSKNPDGKLRLLYEASPLAFLADRAGGAASDGTRPILDIAPTDLHQRTPLFIGNRDEVERLESFQRESAR